ncbi:hypothetical protein SEMRO_1593_G284520.1 [Seminavis robusta]|uniref:Uncharacterized protein n=1 Tax=Seminavis robusta TaxID=568900 RepID=A0A9N8HW34_9STRA|nr:hypothetical protein SEMRO_1593_G284520.1 [Seminavis robusta]|eukprot:Sro1593_g284520.1 n/a (195) ;mRNA; f:12037-12621
MQEDTQIKVIKTEKVGERYNVYIGCKYSTSYRDKIAYQGKENANSKAADLYKDNIRVDRLVDKDAANRHHGRSEAKRTYTQLPPSGKKCPFRFLLVLIPGKHWYIRFTEKSKGCHNHKRIPISEQNRPLSSFSKEELKQAARFSQLTHSGAAVTLTQELTGAKVTAAQLDYNRKKVEGRNPNRAPKTQAEELIH